MYRFTTTMTMFALVLGFQSLHPAFAQDLPSRAVRFADLDVSRSPGAQVLYQRLQAAAQEVCAALEDRDLARHMKYEACVHHAISAAVAKVDRPALTAYYEARTGGGHDSTVRIAQNPLR
ncbi:MAG TPA: UrcA family protein [Steroidobacteraceae bacterium]|nr:UrcA family protein [Steroidobacteraceae bacterium]